MFCADLTQKLESGFPGSLRLLTTSCWAVGHAALLKLAEISFLLKRFCIWP